MKSDTEVCKSASDRWTDNLYLGMKFMKSKANMETSDIEKQFKIFKDLDY